MSLSANKVVQRKTQPAIKKLKCVDGLLHIYKGAHLVYESGNIGYVMPAEDALTHEYAGIAMEELSVTAAQNSADGTYEIEVLPRGCGEEVLMDLSATITIANEGDLVFADTDDTVDIQANILNITGGMVGIIRQFVSGTKAWVQMCQHPKL